MSIISKSLHQNSIIDHRMHALQIIVDNYEIGMRKRFKNSGIFVNFSVWHFNALLSRMKCFYRVSCHFIQEIYYFLGILKICSRIYHNVIVLGSSHQKFYAKRPQVEGNISFFRAHENRKSVVIKANLILLLGMN